jgi:hypothetical protein
LTAYNKIASTCSLTGLRYTKGFYVVPNTCTFSEHYMWALDELFIKHNFAWVIIQKV